MHTSELGVKWSTFLHSRVAHIGTASLPGLKNKSTCLNFLWKLKRKILSPTYNNLFSSIWRERNPKVTRFIRHKAKKVAKEWDGVLGAYPKHHWLYTHYQLMDKWLGHIYGRDKSYFWSVSNFWHRPKVCVILLVLCHYFHRHKHKMPHALS